MENKFRVLYKYISGGFELSEDMEYGFRRGKKLQTKMS